MSSHNFRKTTATTVERSYGLEVARQIMDHDDSRITKEFYVETRKNELPDVRGALESLRPGGMRPPAVSQGETAE